MSEMMDNQNDEFPSIRIEFTNENESPTPVLAKIKPSFADKFKSRKNVDGKLRRNLDKIETDRLLKKI